MEILPPLPFSHPGHGRWLQRLLLAMGPLSPEPAGFRQPVGAQGSARPLEDGGSSACRGGDGKPKAPPVLPQAPCNPTHGAHPAATSIPALWAKTLQILGVFQTSCRANSCSGGCLGTWMEAERRAARPPGTNRFPPQGSRQFWVGRKGSPTAALAPQMPTDDSFAVFCRKEGG